MLNLNTLFHVLLAFNTCLIILEILTPYAEYFLPYFVRSPEEGLRIGTSSMGRFMGIFDQTFISGFAYSLGLMTWVYNFEKKRVKNLLFEGMLLLLLLIGGFASVSKVFFIVGILLSLGLFLFIAKTGTKIMALVFGSIFVLFIAPIFINNWIGIDYLQELFYGIVGETSLDKITSGRLGNDTGIYSTVLPQDFPMLIGAGFTLYNLPFFDSEFVQFFVQGGLIAIVLYFLILLKNISIWFSLKRKFYKEKGLLFAVLVLGFITAFGGPVFLMNRVRVFYFLLLFFLYKISVSVKNEKIKVI
ncbi:hypothetical protein [Maribacter orientalis]|nr:hypothetical protein [Maribacter orientalis]